MATDAELPDLIGAARKGDRAAFDEIVRRTYDDTYTLAYRLTGDHDDAGDVAQDAYIRAYKHLRRFRGEARFTTWLYRITANCANTHLGRRQRHTHDELLDESPIADPRPDIDPELRADAAALRADIQAALSRLPERLRAVVVLRDVYDLSHRAIADELDISETAAKVRLHRARHRLRELVFGSHGDESADDPEASDAV